MTTVTWDELLAVARAIETYAPINDIPDWPARQSHYVDAFPKSLVPILLSNASTVGGIPSDVRSVAPFEAFAGLAIQPAELTWGYTLESKSDVIFNTRIESAATSPLWHSSFESRHCIVPVHAFYEPHKTEKVRNSSGREVKQVYRFEEPYNSIMLLAGIWDKDRFSILTTEPDEYVAPIHPRMPIVLDQQSATQWLSFQGFDVGKSIPLASSPLYENEASSSNTNSGSGQQLSLF